MKLTELSTLLTQGQSRCDDDYWEELLETIELRSPFYLYSTYSYSSQPCMAYSALTALAMSSFGSKSIIILLNSLAYLGMSYSAILSDTMLELDTLAPYYRKNSIQSVFLFFQRSLSILSLQLRLAESTRMIICFFRAQNAVLDDLRASDGLAAVKCFFIAQMQTSYRLLQKSYCRRGQNSLFYTFCRQKTILFCFQRYQQGLFLATASDSKNYLILIMQSQQIQSQCISRRRLLTNARICLIYGQCFGMDSFYPALSSQLHTSSTLVASILLVEAL